MIYPDYEQEYNQATAELDRFCMRFALVWADLIIERMGQLQEQIGDHADEPADCVYAKPN